MATDETLIRVLLNGYVRHDEKGLRRQAYLESDGEDELAARAAMARHLRSDSPLTREQRDVLADLFDPDPGVAFRNDRRIIFQYRRRGRRSQHLANTQISQHIWERLCSGWNVESAVQDATTKYELSREDVFKIWSRFRPIYETF
jgi:hypothetical protein